MQIPPITGESTRVPHPFQKLAQQHYENFPVGSFLVPKVYRAPVHLIYAFARVADDIADEGTKMPEERIASLDAWQRALENALNGSTEDDFFVRLADVVQRFTLSPQLLTDLLIAFRRDAGNPVYKTENDVLDYCRYSANPIGRLLLQLFVCDTEENRLQSDAICTGLQLANFWQDLSVDIPKGRHYLSDELLQRHGLERSDLSIGEKKDAFVAMMKEQVEATRRLFEQGRPLLKKAPRALRLELTLVWHGGMTILKKIAAMGYDTRRRRPSLDAADKAGIFIAAVME